MWRCSLPHGGSDSRGGAAAGGGGVAAVTTAAITTIAAAPRSTPKSKPMPLPTNTPLHAAADAGDASAVETLLRGGADPNSRVKRPRYDKGATALHLAAKGGHLEVALALLAAGAETSGRDAHGHVAVVRALLSAGEPTDLIASGRKGGACDDTPLHLASASGQVEAMAALLEAGADVDAGDEIGNTPLHVVADARSLEFLLAAGANPNLAAESPYGCGTPLGSYCTLIHRLETDQKVVRRATAQVQALLRHGADTGVRASREWVSSSSSSASSSSSSCPILSCAAKNGVPGIVAALLDAGLDPNGRDREGWAPLHDAAWGNHVEVLRLLLQAGAEKNASTGRGGWTALHLACRYTSVDCVLELLRWGVDLDPKTGVDADDDFWCRDLMFGGGRVGASKGGGKTPAEVIGLKNRAAPAPTPTPTLAGGPGFGSASIPPTEGGDIGDGGGGGGWSVDPAEDEDEQMEVFDEETGQRDTSAAGRNAIRRALRREVSWRRRRGVVLAKTFLENRLKVGAAGLPPPVCLGGGGDAAGIGCLRNADSEGVGPESVRTRGVAFGDGAAGGRSKRCRADVGGMWAAPTTGGRGSGGVQGVVLEEAVPLRGVLEGLMDLAGCEEALFRQVVMFL
eukprot:jgi/Undpi1/13540/HiC_scaffold_8.g03199.m1